MMEKDEKKEYHDFTNVEAMNNYLTAEEFPDGPYGSPFRVNEPVRLKSNPWKKGQRRYSSSNYEFKALHKHIPRQFPGAHPTEDDSHSDQ